MAADGLRAALAEICAQANLDHRDAELIKFTNNAVFRLPGERVVVRIAGSSTTRSRIEKVVRVAQWLAARDAPAARLLPGITQPVSAADQLATLWELVPDTGTVCTGTDLADLLRRFHVLTPPDPPLPTWWPFEEIRGRLAESDGIDPADHAYLAQRCDELEAELTTIRYVLPAGPIHGDAIIGNLIPGAAGPVLCDFDSTSHGPREWDLTPVAVGRIRFAYTSDDQARLAPNYGFDVTTWDGFPVLRGIRELKLVTSVLPVLSTQPRLRDQWRHRIRSLKTGDHTARWTPY